MTVKPPIAPRQTKPELEHDYVRSPRWATSRPETAGFIRCLSHGFPTRWRAGTTTMSTSCTSSPPRQGKVFVGDWIGSSSPASWC